MSVLYPRTGVGIGRLWLASAGMAFVVAGLLALAMRWRLAWPGAGLPVLGELLGWPGGTVPLEVYARLFTLHGTVMMWLVASPAILWGLGTACLPAMVGRPLALRGVATSAFWLAMLGAAVLLVGWGGASGWTGYAPLSSGPLVADGWVPYQGDAASWLRIGRGEGWDRAQSAWSVLALYAAFSASCAFVGSFLSMVPGRGFWVLLKICAALGLGYLLTAGLQFVVIDGQTAWFAAVGIWGISGIAAGIPLLATVATRPGRGPLPLAVWGWSAAAGVAILAGPVLVVAMATNALDAHGLTGFFAPERGGSPLLHQHLFWFYAHPLVYLMILPAYGLVGDALAAACGGGHYLRRTAAICIVAVAVLGFGVWAHHMFQSGLDPAGALAFSAASVLVALPSAVLVVSWLGTLWLGRFDGSAAGWAAVAFVSLFAVGGLSGLVLAAPAINVQLHDTYFVVAHLHYTLFGGAIFGVFAGLYALWPRLTGGRRLDERLGRWHIVLTYLAFNGTFGVMHVLGWHGMPRRHADPSAIPGFAKYGDWQALMTVAAMGLGVVQLLLLANVVRSSCRRSE